MSNVPPNKGYPMQTTMLYVVSTVVYQLLSTLVAMVFPGKPPTSNGMLVCMIQRSGHSTENIFSRQLEDN